MRYLEEINTGFIAQHLAHMKPEDRESVRKQAQQRSQAYSNITPQAMRKFILNNVVDTWFDSWYWRIVGEVSHYAERNVKEYTRGTERDENWLFRYITDYHPTLADEQQLSDLQIQLTQVMPGVGFSFKEIGDRLIEHANETYARGVVGAMGDNPRGLTVGWADCELRHAFRPVGEPWY